MGHAFCTPDKAHIVCEQNVVRMSELSGSMTAPEPSEGPTNSERQTARPAFDMQVEPAECAMVICDIRVQEIAEE